MKLLQFIIIAASIIIAIVALLIFGGILPGFRLGQGGQSGEISFWGTLPEKNLSPVLEDFRQRFQNIKVDYRRIDSKNYIDELVKALAAGQGPDVFMLEQDQIIKQRDLVFVLDAKTYPLRAFRDNFADISELYARPEGITGLPFYIDPLVLFWNRDLFRNAGLTLPPKFWDEFLQDAAELTVKDGSRLIQSGAALGEFSNISRAKDILALLILQTGNKIVDPQTLRPVFTERTGALSPAEEALIFFASFSDPVKNNYSWSRARSEALEAFGAGGLAMYIGYASEIERILDLNPHLNFDVSRIPQIRGEKLQATYGRSAALTLSKQSANKAAALTFMYELTGLDSQNLLSQNSFLAPSLRSALAEKQENPVLDIFYKSAVQSLGWLDPDPAETKNIWKEMVESFNAGAKNANQAVTDAQRKFETLVPRQN